MIYSWAKNVYIIKFDHPQSATQTNYMLNYFEMQQYWKECFFYFTPKSSWWIFDGMSITPLLENKNQRQIPARRVDDAWLSGADWCLAAKIGIVTIFGEWKHQVCVCQCVCVTTWLLRLVIPTEYRMWFCGWTCVDGYNLKRTSIAS